MQFTVKLISSITLAATLASAFVVPRQAAAGNYTLIFSNQTGAVQATDFITFGLFDTTAECTAFCDSVTTCGFANSYHDNNGKGGSPQLTCSLYVACHDNSTLLNTGGQEQPDGTTNFITDSDGWCKDTTTPTEPTTTAPTEPTTTAPTEPTTTAPTKPTTTAAEPTTTAPAEPTTTTPTKPTTTAAKPTTTAPA